jgi:hypothetical protein
MHFDNLLFLLLVLVAVLLRALASAANKASKGSKKPQQRSASTPPLLPRAPVESDADRIRKFLEALGQPAESQPPPPVVHRTDIPPRPVAPVAPPPGPFTFPERRLTPQERRKRAVILHEPPTPPAPRVAPTIAPAAQTFTPPSMSEISAYQITTEAPPELPPLAQATEQPALPRVLPERVSHTVDIAAMLASASGLREVIVLREILGPPRSLQPLELIEI